MSIQSGENQRQQYPHLDASTITHSDEIRINAVGTTAAAGLRIINDKDTLTLRKELELCKRKLKRTKKELENCKKELAVVIEGSNQSNNNYNKSMFSQLRRRSLYKNRHLVGDDDDDGNNNNVAESDAESDVDFGVEINVEIEGDTEEDTNNETVTMIPTPTVIDNNNINGSSNIGSNITTRNTTRNNITTAVPLLFSSSTSDEEHPAAIASTKSLTDELARLQKLLIQQQQQQQQQQTAAISSFGMPDLTMLNSQVQPQLHTPITHHQEEDTKMVEGNGQQQHQLVENNDIITVELKEWFKNVPKKRDKKSCRHTDTETLFR